MLRKKVIPTLSGIYGSLLSLLINLDFIYFTYTLYTGSSLCLPFIPSNR